MNTFSLNHFKEWLKNQFDQRKLKIQSALEQGELSLFFKFEKDIYGCGEESRLVFAKLKAADKDVHPAWHKEAGFLAMNLNHDLQDGEFLKRIFYKKDIKN